MDTELRNDTSPGAVPYNNLKIKLLRILAWFIDWNLIGLVILLITYIFFFILGDSLDSYSPIPYIFGPLIVLMYPVTFVLRDMIFGNRSVGKRITGLIVLDKKTGCPAKSSQKIVRGLAIFFIAIDTLVLLICGRSVGDFLADTVVVLKKDILNREPAEIPNDTPKRNPKQSKKTAIIAVTAVITAFILFVSFIVFMINISLNEQKDTEEYKLAYEYLVKSERFEELGIDESKIKLKEYSNYIYREDGNKRRDIEFGFSLGFGLRLTVVCHEENGEIYVCEECTNFH